MTANSSRPVGQPDGDIAIADDERLDAALAEYFELHDAGLEIDRSAFLRKHIQLAGILGQVLGLADSVEEMAGPVRLQTIVEETAGAAADNPPPVALKSFLPYQFGRYQTLGLLGEGAMGAVYLAKDSSLERWVALKIPREVPEGNEHLAKRFQREARSAAVLHHPNICPVHDVGEIDGQLFLSMAYIPGEPLSEFLKQHPQLPPKQTVRLVRKLALALQEAHDHGIVHRDLKPSNIIINRSGEPIITDFGLARMIDREGAETLTHEGQILGTPAYMSPEQIDSQGDVGPQSDIFSLGIIFYEMLTGARPFQGSIAALFSQIVAGKFPLPSKVRGGIDPRLEAICVQMLLTSRQDRYQTMAQVAEDLNAWFRDQVINKADQSTSPVRLVDPPPAVPTATETRSLSGMASVLEASTSRRDIQLPPLQVLPPEKDLPGPAEAGRARLARRSNERAEREGYLALQRFAVACGLAAVVLIGLLAWWLSSRNAGTEIPHQLPGEPSSRGDYNATLRPIVKNAKDASQAIEDDPVAAVATAPSAEPAEHAAPNSPVFASDPPIEAEPPAATGTPATVLPPDNRPSAAPETPAAAQPLEKTEPAVSSQPPAPTPKPAVSIPNRLPVVVQIDEIKELLEEMKRQGKFGTPPDHRRMQSWADAEVARRHQDGRLARNLNVKFTFTQNGMSVSVNTPPG